LGRLNEAALLLRETQASPTKPSASRAIVYLGSALHSGLPQSRALAVVKDIFAIALGVHLYRSIRFGWELRPAMRNLRRKRKKPRVRLSS